MRAFKHLSVILLAGWLGACGPITHTDYEIVPPPTEMGRTCANQCLQIRASCRQQCRLETQQCEQSESMRAQSDYLSYVYRQQRFGRPPVRGEGDFYRQRICENNCEDICDEDYRVCHTNCGGQVIPHEMCTAFCGE